MIVPADLCTSGKSVKSAMLSIGFALLSVTISSVITHRMTGLLREGDWQDTRACLAIVELNVTNDCARPSQCFCGQLSVRCSLIRDTSV